MAFTSFDYVLGSRGLMARYAIDRMGEAFYLNLDNCEVREEISISSAYGTELITKNGTTPSPLTDTSIHTLGRMKGLDSPYRYSGSGNSLYRRTGDTAGSYTRIKNGGMSGERFSMVEFRPDFSAVPYTFFADKSIMLKDNGALSAPQSWGSYPPTTPPTLQVLEPTRVTVDKMSGLGSTRVNVTGAATSNRVNTTLGTAVVAGTIATVTPASMTNIVAGMLLTIGGTTEDVYVLSKTATTFTAKFVNAHLAADTVVDTYLSGSVAANTTATISQAGALNLSTIGGETEDDGDIIAFWLLIDAPANLKEVRILFDVGDGSYTQDYYMKAVAAATFQPVIDSTITASRGFQNRVYDRGSGGADIRLHPQDDAIHIGAITEFEDLLPGDDPILGRLRPSQIMAGASRWTRVEIKRSEFTAVGEAGQPGKGWANVNAWRVSIQSSATASVAFGLDDIFAFGGTGKLDTFAGVKYDYRYTFFNIATGYETNPSMTLDKAFWVNPRRQYVKVTWTDPTDAQFTHVRLYRRGGTTPTGWHQVAQVAVGTGTWTDGMADIVAVEQHFLEIDNDPPVTSSLRTLVNTTLGTGVTAGSSQTVTPASMTDIYQYQYVTIDEGENEEVVIVQSKIGSTFTAYFQKAHGSTARVSANARPGKTMHIAALAFGRVWLAGDSDNPHILYYSKVNRPESFSPADYIEVGSPSDPIMGMLEIRGQLYVWTLKRIFNILGAGGGTPVPVKTAATHGLAATWAIASSQGVIYYLSHDGIYAFTGIVEKWIADPVSWIFDGLNLGPVKAMDKSLYSTVQFAYSDQLFIAYTDTSGARRRLIFQDRFQRWRNDSYAATAMFFEEDTSTLVVAKSDGLIRKDRTNDYHDAGATHDPVSFTLQTQVLDQKAPDNDKVYQDLTLDLNTASQPVHIYLLFDNGVTSLDLGTVTTAQRSKVIIPINAGLGQKSKNIELKVTGSVTSAVTLYQAHMTATIEPEARLTFDTYWVDFGTPEWKVVKQAWFEYQSTAPINVSVYLDGAAVPEYTFTLASTADVRQDVRVRLPARKAKLWRLVAESSDQTKTFKLFSGCKIEFKPVGGPKGWLSGRLIAEAGVQ